jgi:hypothetical protein
LIGQLVQLQFVRRWNDDLFGSFVLLFLFLLVPKHFDEAVIEDGLSAAICGSRLSIVRESDGGRLRIATETNLKAGI